MGETTPKITVFYDGAGPRCVRDRVQDEPWAGPAGASVCGFDLTGQDYFFTDRGHVERVE